MSSTIQHQLFNKMYVWIHLLFNTQHQLFNVQGIIAEKVKSKFRISFLVKEHKVFFSQTHRRAAYHFIKDRRRLRGCLFGIIICPDYIIQQIAN
jgi:hypothetical protein